MVQFVACWNQSQSPYGHERHLDDSGESDSASGARSRLRLADRAQRQLARVPSGNPLLYFDAKMDSGDSALQSLSLVWKFFGRFGEHTPGPNAASHLYRTDLR